mmetsp:Transcript_32872/g.58913  ORF Transcript_32872/g.58913 Transcript_32872/m.58913 type:complete len:202 (-) Transcript_32872:701-1306(-)
MLVLLHSTRARRASVRVSMGSLAREERAVDHVAFRELAGPSGTSSSMGEPSGRQTTRRAGRILPSVSVPVLSEQISVTLPSCSSATILRTMALDAAMRRTEIAIVTVISTIAASGRIATRVAEAYSSAWSEICQLKAQKMSTPKRIPTKKRPYIRRSIVAVRAVFLSPLPPSARRAAILPISVFPPTKTTTPRPLPCAIEV